MEQKRREQDKPTDRPHSFRNMVSADLRIASPSAVHQENGGEKEFDDHCYDILQEKQRKKERGRHPKSIAPPIHHSTTPDEFQSGLY